MSDSSEEQGAIQGAGQGASMGAAAGPWGALIGGIAGGAYGWWNAQSQAAQQKLELIETMRRLRLGQKQTMGKAVSRGAASGIEFDSGSLQTFLAAMQDEFDRQADWLRRSGGKSVSATQQAGNWNFASDLGSSMFQFGESNNWWRTSPSQGG